MRKLKRKDIVTSKKNKVSLDISSYNNSIKNLNILHLYQPAQEVKDLIGNITPKTITATNPGSIGLPSSIQAAGNNSSSENLAERVGASRWNAAGTWEERDMTDYVKGRLTSICSSALVQNELGKISVTSAKTVEGDAQIVIASSKKRHIYDFNVTLEFEIILSQEDGEEKPKKFKGTQVFPEISPISTFESSLNFKKTIPDSFRSKVDTLTKDLKELLITEFRNFDAEYKAL